MIVRTWRGATRAADADRYAEYIDATGLRAYSETPGNLGSLMLRRPAEVDGEPAAEFLVVSFWDSEAAIQRFAGTNPSQAVFYPEDEAFLVRRDLTVDHFDVVAHRRGAGGAEPFEVLAGE
jgi:heme-degrading monooxygenase HmoA